jgi:cation transport protein ChaC
MPSSTPITRENLSDGTLRQMVLDRDGPNTSVLTDEELKASRRSLIPDDYDQDVWIFAYGSLIWNPLMELKGQILGRIYGYHRRFCLRTKIGRGTPEQPGLILGLDNGGSCTGLGLRIDRSIFANELDLLWRREMINGSYTPKKILIHTDCGRILDGITFVMNHESPNYVGELSLEEKARVIASASGFIGTSLEYLELTYNSLNALGIHDGYLDRLIKMTSDHR